MNHGDGMIGNVPPLYLTLQQQFIGSTLLRLMLQVHFLGSRGLQPWPNAHAHSSIRYSPTASWNNAPPSVLLAGVCFCLGFYTTNLGFQSSSAAFVETIKAAEPLTSASLAVLWGIEVLSREETLSLGAIVTGVLLSTIGGQQATGVNSTIWQSVLACTIVMLSNLCFSFRGLYQKLLRATPEGNAQALDDLNLQFRMQQIGVTLLIVPALFWDGTQIVATVWNLKRFFTGHIMLKYLLLSLINGCAFTCYNLASTYILSRISVVHHAALNCLRRIFAIIVTSLVFAVPISVLGLVGIVISVIGFMSFTHFKVQKQKEPKPLSSLLPMSVIK
jgi:drug/metabolite transporter (DMT)-like permease